MSSGAQAQIAASQASTEAQAEAARNALAFSREQFDYMKQLRKPYTDAGASATQMLMNLLGLTPNLVHNGGGGGLVQTGGGGGTLASLGSRSGGSNGGSSGGGAGSSGGGGNAGGGAGTHPPQTSSGEGWQGPGYYDVDGNWHDGYPTGPGVVYGNTFFPAGSPQLDLINRMRSQLGDDAAHTSSNTSRSSGNTQVAGPVFDPTDTSGATPWQPATSGMASVTDPSGKTFRVPSNLASFYAAKGFRV